MTREELEKVIFKTHSPLTVKEVMYCVDKYVAKVREDTIAECIGYLQGIDNYVADMVEDIFKLKEQKK